MPDFLNVKEVALLFRVGTLTIRKLSTTGAFPAPLHVGRRLVWRREDLFTWADAQRAARNTVAAAPAAAKN